MPTHSKKHSKKHSKVGKVKNSKVKSSKLDPEEKLRRRKLFNIYLARKLAKRKGELVDIAVKPKETRHGRAHLDTVSEFGCSFPIDKPIHELELIGQTTQDDKSSKRQRRLEFLKYGKKSSIVCDFYKVLCNILNGLDGNSQHPAHIVFTASGGNLITFLAKLIINILETPTGNLLKYNEMILKALEKMNGSYTRRSVIESIYDHFNTDEGQKLISVFKDVLSFSDFDFNISYNKLPEEEEGSQKKQKVPVKSDFVTDFVQFLLIRLKSSGKCGTTTEEPEKTLEEKTHVKEYEEKIIKAACYATVNTAAYKDRFKAVGLDAPTIHSLFHSQMQDKYLDVLNEIISTNASEKEKEKLDDCLTFLSSLKQRKSSNEQATKHNVSVISSLYPTDQTDALIEHTRMYTIHINAYIEKWLAGELTIEQAPAYHNMPYEHPKSYHELARCFETIDDIMFEHDGLIVKLLSDIIHYILREEKIFHTGYLLETINDSYRGSEGCPDPVTMAPTTMNYSPFIDEDYEEAENTALYRVVKLYDTLLDSKIYPEGAQIILIPVNGAPPQPSVAPPGAPPGVLPVAPSGAPPFAPSSVLPVAPPVAPPGAPSGAPPFAPSGAPSGVLPGAPSVAPSGVLPVAPSEDLDFDDLDIRALLEASYDNEPLGNLPDAQRSKAPENYGTNFYDVLNLYNDYDKYDKYDDYDDLDDFDFDAFYDSYMSPAPASTLASGIVRKLRIKKPLTKKRQKKSNTHRKGKTSRKGRISRKGKISRKGNTHRKGKTSRKGSTSRKQKLRQNKI
jgi:hypothetical protein